MNESAGPTNPVRQTQVEEWMNTIGDTVARVREKSNQIRDRLGSLLANRHSGESAEAMQPPELVELADRLRTINYAALDTEAILDSIAERLEV